MQFLPLNLRLKNKYLIKKCLIQTDFSNIYIVEFESKEYILKECFPIKLVMRDENNAIFFSKYKKEFELVKNSFVKEAKILKKLNQKIDKVVKIIEYFEENNTIYIIEEYCNYFNLKQYILNKKDLKFEKIIEIFYKILEIIEKIHNENIIHKDLKPSNILISENKNIKIIDFGASIHKNEKNGKFVKVSEGYSAIELHSNKTEIDERADIYSLFAILYFMLNKKKIKSSVERFYDDELNFESYYKFYGKNEKNQKIEKIIKKGLEIEKIDRFNNVSEVIENLKCLNYL